MTLDHLKILIFNEDLINDLYNNSLLNEFSIYQSYSNNINKESQEIRQATFTKVYEEIYFCFYVKEDKFTKLEILFKPHYYFNDNLHNANDFTAVDCINVLNEIKDIFNFPTKELHILNIEYGINAISPIDCKNLITYAVYHEKNEFITSSDNLKFSKISFKYDKNGKANNYKKIKFYAKGLQFPKYTDKNTFRFEVKSKRRSYIQSLGIYTYEDLLKIETYHTLAENIRTEFKSVLILDIDNKGENLNSKDKNKLTEHLNTFKWIKAIQGSKNTFNNTKRAYFELLDKTGNNIHKNLEKIINNKLNVLIKDCAILTPPKKIKDCANFNTYIMENGTINNNKNCIVTGLPLTHENEDAKYIRTSTLNYIHNYDVKAFEEVCSFLLSHTQGNRPKFESGIIKHLAKQVRNRYYNQLTIRQTGYKQRIYHNQLGLNL